MDFVSGAGYLCISCADNWFKQNPMSAEQKQKFIRTAIGLPEMVGAAQSGREENPMPSADSMIADEHAGSNKYYEIAEALYHKGYIAKDKAMRIASKTFEHMADDEAGHARRLQKMKSRGVIQNPESLKNILDRIKYCAAVASQTPGTDLALEYMRKGMELWVQVLTYEERSANKQYKVMLDEALAKHRMWLKQYGLVKVIDNDSDDNVW